jgi:hypothetical protein
MMALGLGVTFVIAGPMTAAPSWAQGIAAGIGLGDYAGANNPAGIARFGKATHTHPTFASDYLPRASGWGALEDTSGLSAWAGSGYRLVLGVPLFPDGTGSSLAAGATGAYDSNFATLAQHLVSQGLSNAILRLGWEFNGGWYGWKVQSVTDASNFTGFWRHIVTTMRSVSGQNFAFLWDPNDNGSTNYTPDQAYPGDAYVDYVGVDLYDNCWCTPQTPQNAWATDLSFSWGLNWLAGFAPAHNKPIALPEWSVDYRSDGHGLGDDPYFIHSLATWIAAQNTAFTCIFSFDTANQRNNINDGRFRKAKAAFRQDFGTPPHHHAARAAARPVVSFRPTEAR